MSNCGSKRYMAALDDGVKEVDVSSTDIVVLRAKLFCNWLNIIYPPIQAKEDILTNINQPVKEYGFFHKLFANFKRS